MRNWINLIESYETTIKGIGDSQVEVFRNPSRKEWQECSQHDMVRAFIVGNDLLIWSVFGAVHQMVRDSLSLPNTAIPVTIEGEYRGAVYISVTDNAKSPILHNPNIRDLLLDNSFLHHFSDIDIGFFDQAIVGDWEDGDWEDGDWEDGDLMEAMTNNWPKTISGNDLSIRVEALHHTPEDFQDGDIATNIEAFGKYDLVNVPISTLQTGIYTIYDDLVDNYATLDSNPPPIIVDPAHGIVIDGNHRVEAALRKGQSTILAYVGDLTTYTYPDEADDEEWHPDGEW
jgi:hypothetical protein